MKHFNSNIPCVVTTRAANRFEISSLVVIPLNTGLQIHKEIPICDMLFRVEEKGVLTTKEWDLTQRHGIDVHTAALLFEKWYAKLNLRSNKRILPVSFNWPLHYARILQWLDYDGEGVPFMFDFFSHMYRDILPIALYWSEVAELNDEVPPFPAPNLTNIAKRLGVSRGKTHLDEAFCIADTYDKIISLKIPAIDLPLRYPAEVKYEDAHGDDQYDLDDAQFLQA